MKQNDDENRVGDSLPEDDPGGVAVQSPAAPLGVPTLPGPAAPEIDHPSQEDRLMRKAQEIIAKTPDVRREKVVALKEAVQQGTYRFDSRLVARRMILQLLLERKFKSPS